MSAERLFFPPEYPEWSRSGRFFLFALLLHALVLFYPMQIAMGKPLPLPAKTVMVRLVETARAPAVPLPPQSQPLPATPMLNKNRISHPQPLRPVLAVTQEQAAPSVAVPAVVPGIATPLAPTSSPSVPAAKPVLLTAARFDAAYLDNPAPKYPLLSRRLGEEGKVLLKVRVSPAGLPVAVDLEKSSSFERLDEAALQVVSRWRFVPAKRGDENIEASVIVPLVFRLDD